MDEFLTKLESACKDKIEYYVELANRRFGIKMPVPIVMFNVYDGCAGKADISRHLILINPTLLRENGDKLINDTCPHEVSHLVAYFLNKGRRIDPHGLEWINVCHKLGVPANRCHRFSTQNVLSRVEKRNRDKIKITEVQFD